MSDFLNGLYTPRGIQFNKASIQVSRYDEERSYCCQIELIIQRRKKRDEIFVSDIVIASDLVERESYADFTRQLIEMINFDNKLLTALVSRFKIGFPK